MKWFRLLMERYENWRVKTEQGLVEDVLKIQLESLMSRNGVIVVKEEKEEK